MNYFMQIYGLSIDKCMSWKLWTHPNNFPGPMISELFTVYGSKIDFNTSCTLWSNVWCTKTNFDNVLAYNYYTNEKCVVTATLFKYKSNWKSYK